jgi:hypothetical protein
MSKFFKKIKISIRLLVVTIAPVGNPKRRSERVSIFWRVGDEEKVRHTAEELFCH